MTSSVEKVKDTSSFLNVEPIVGQPTYDSIRALHKKLNANAASVNSHLGNGRLGLLYRIVTPAVYRTLFTTEFHPPIESGTHSEHP